MSRVWGADWGWRPTPTMVWPYARLKAMGLDFIGRYVGSLTAAELAEIHAAGLGCYVFCELGGPGAPLRGAPQADADADAALSWAGAIGWRSPIAFACDTEVDDATPTLPYYRRIALRLGDHGRAYGDTLLLNGLYAAGLRKVAAGVGCSAWSYGTRSPWEVVHQYYDDFPADLFPGLEAAGLHYGANYDANELMLPGADFVNWPAAPPPIEGDEMKRFIVETGDSRIYFESGAQIAWMSAPDAWADYAAREGIPRAPAVVRAGYLAGRPGKMSTIPPANKAAAHAAGMSRAAAAHLPPHIDTADVTETWPWAGLDHPDALKKEGE